MGRMSHLPRETDTMMHEHDSDPAVLPAETEAPVAKLGQEPLTGATMSAWRERMGFSQREAAAQVGCSREAWSGWEAGRKQVPHYIGLAMAALALGMAGHGGATPGKGE
jgi:DNA-binding transcriptional regulator YiaG